MTLLFTSFRRQHQLYTHTHKFNPFFSPSLSSYSLKRDRVRESPHARELSETGNGTGRRNFAP